METNESTLRNLLLERAKARHRPLNCTFELTYRCTFKCPMCYIRMTDEQACRFGRLRTLDEWIDMGRQVRDAGVLQLTLTGGECTHYPQFPELYEALSRLGFQVSLMSNAGIYSDAVWAALRRYPPYGISVTLYGGSNETYERVTGLKNGLDRVLENLNAIKELGIPLNLVFTMTRQNMRDYQKIGHITKELNAPLSICSDLTPHSRDASFTDIESYRLTPAEQACMMYLKPDQVDLLPEWAAVLEKELENFRLPEIVPGATGGKDYCNGSFVAAAIYWNGDMNTCVSLAGTNGYKPFEIGFEAAWQQMQKDRETRFAQPLRCRGCELIHDCLFSCPARNFEGTGDMQTPDIRTCQYAYLHRKYRELYGDLSPVAAAICE